jgi:DNA invertase Pin-like site-specific DNA recombinase
VPKTVKPVRCALYTRKSTEEGLDQEFSSLDAQRAAGRAYVKSQASLGWICLPTRYDDGGFTGGNLERPALQQLLADIEAGHVDCVVVYKVDRLSRSLLDFARLMALFEEHQVAFVSVTQQFNTGTSMGRLVLNVLLSFAQFEREIISERTRDKIAATRRKGQWCGGMPLLGYDVDPRRGKLVVNEAEAEQVRAIFGLYLEQGGLLATVDELARRGWTTKRWQTRKGHIRGGKPFSKGSLHHLLTNVVYRGQIKYKDKIHPGQHKAIVDAYLGQQVQARLSRQNRSRDRLPSGALLKGLLQCRPCGTAMTPTYARKNGGRRYAYYVCTSALKYGRRKCPSRTLPALAIELWVLERLYEAAHEGETPYAELARWDQLPFDERRRLLQSWIRCVDYDGSQDKVRITLAAPSKNGSSDSPKRPRKTPREWPLRLSRRSRLCSEEAPGRLPRVARLMALAIRLEGLLRKGAIKDQADLARLGQVSRARISQILNLAHLAPDIQEQLLFLPLTGGRDRLRLADLQPLCRLWGWQDQRRSWRLLCQRLTLNDPQVLQKELEGGGVPR